MREVYGGIEGGGTWFVCALGTGPDDLVDEQRIPTTTPAETLGRVVGFLTRPRPGVRLAGVGLATFGPLELDPRSVGYGRVTRTPKPGWSGAGLVAPLRAALGVPVGFDTDVNGAALGEARHGAGRDGADPLVYVTVGTGIGAGAVVGGALLHGLIHPEMGHLLVARAPGDERFAGTCPFHGGDCVEGLASGGAVAARAGRPAESLAPEDPAWALCAGYLARLLHAITLVLSPRRIVLGGGVGAGVPGLLARVRAELVAVDRGYLATDALGSQGYVVAPALGARSGVLGAIELARRAT